LSIIVSSIRRRGLARSLALLPALAAVACLGTGPASGARLPLPRILGKAEGLKSSQVHDVAVGPQGFIWLAGPSGLARYTGQGIDVFGTVDGLSSPSLRSLAPDGATGLWIGHDAGLDRWTRERGFAPAVPAADWRFGFVEAILPVAAGEVWLGTREGLVNLRLPAGTVETAMEGKLVSSLARSSTGVIWAAGPTLGLWRLDEDGWSRPAHGGWAAVAPVRELAPSADGRLFVGGDGLVEIDSDGRTVGPIEPPWPQRTVTAIRRTGDELWTSIGGRVALFRAAGSAWTFAEAALPEDGALAIEIDGQGNVWLATDRTGAVRFSALRSAIARLTQPCDTAVLSVAAVGEGEIILGGTACTWRARADDYEMLSEIPALAGLQAWDVLRASDGRLWVASNEGLVELDPDGDELVPTSLVDPARCLIESGGAVYVGTLKGLFVLTDGGFEELLTSAGESLGYVYTLARGPAGRIWAGTLGNGLWVLEPPGAPRRSELPGLAATANVYSVAFHADGAVAVSEDSAVLLFDPDGGAPPLRVATDSPSWVLAFDAAGRLLRGSSEGLAILDRRTGVTVSSIGTGTGLAGGELTTSRSLYQRPDGSVVCGMDGGASLVDLAALQAAPPLPAPVTLRVAGESFRVVGGQRQLTSGAWSLDIFPGVPWFLDERGLAIRYRMPGFVDEWTDLPRDSASIRFTSLPVGRYALEAQAVSSLTAPGPAATLLEFEVVRPWWWLPVVALGLLAAAGLGGLVPWLRARALARRGAMLERLVEDRTEELALTLAEMERIAMEDRLTGLANRRRLHQELARLESRAQRTGQDFVMVVLDLDSLKKINDRWGHDAGDAVLRQTAARLVAAARQTDMVARYGGDEFVTVGWDNEVQTGTLAERQHAALAGAPMTLPDGSTVAVDGSFGVCSWMTAGCDADRLFKRADRALYAAKRTGRRVTVWSAALEEEDEEQEGTLAAE